MTKSVFTVDTDNLTASETLEFLESAKNKFRNRKLPNFFDSFTKEFDSLNDLFFGKDFSLPELFSGGYNKMTGWKAKFPFYNTKIISENEYQIEIALAGYDKKDIIIYDDKGVLTVSTTFDETCSKGDNETKIVPPSVSESAKYEQYPIYLHRGLTHKSFGVSFKLPEKYEIFSPKFENGILTINIKRLDNKDSPSKRIDIA